MSEQKPSHVVEGIVRRAPRQNCWVLYLGKGTKKFLQYWRSPRTQLPPLFLNWWRLEPPRLFLELATWPNWAFGGKRPWSGRWPRTRWSLCQRSIIPLWRWENLPEGQPSLQHSPNQAFMVEWPGWNHYSVKGTWQPTWEFSKWHLKNRRFSGLMNPRWNSLAWMPSVTFSAAGTGRLVRIKGKMNGAKYSEPWRKHVPQHSGPQTGQDNDLKHTAKTMQERLWDKSQCPWVTQPEPGLEPDQTQDKLDKLVISTMCS